MALLLKGIWITCLVLGASLTLLVPAGAAPVDACKSLLAQFKAAAGRANREIDSTAANLQEAVSRVPNDKARVSLIARSCAASAEARGVLTSYRIVAAECMGDTPERSDFLNDLDRAISKIRVMLDRACD
jgi:hypothetical protein